MTGFEILRLVPFKIWLATALGIVGAIWGFGQYQYNRGETACEERYRLAPLDSTGVIIPEEAIPEEAKMEAPGPAIVYLPTQFDSTEFLAALRIADSLLTLDARRKEFIAHLLLSKGDTISFTTSALANDSFAIVLNGDIYEHFNPIANNFGGEFTPRVLIRPFQYPHTYTRVEHYVPQRQNLIDLSIQVQFASIWARPVFERSLFALTAGPELHFADVHLTAHVGLASLSPDEPYKYVDKYRREDNQELIIWLAGIKWIPTQNH